LHEIWKAEVKHQHPMVTLIFLRNAKHWKGMKKMRSCKDSKKFGKLQWSIAYVREKRKS